MKVLKIFKEKKIGLSFLLLFFILLAASLVLQSNFLIIYPMSIFFFILIFIFSQYFDFSYKYFIGFALNLLIICLLLLIFKFDILAEYFANYVYGFLLLCIIGYFFDNLREKLKSKGTFKIYKKVFLSILVIFILSTAFIFLKDYWQKFNYTVLIKENLVKFADSIKGQYTKTFKKDIYYSGLDMVKVNGKEISQDIIINMDNPGAGSSISEVVDLSGWAIETNSIINTGIDRIEFFFDGKPGKGKFLGSFSVPYYKSNIETVKLLENLYLQFYNKRPSKVELNYWTINLEWRILPFSEVVLNIVNSSGIINKNLSNEEFVKVLYRGLLNREVDEEGLEHWTDLLNAGGADRDGVLRQFIDSEEFKTASDYYLKAVPLRKETLNIIRKDVGAKYGKQFYLSGFNFKFDSTKLINGKHSIYIYSHSPIFGWDYKTLEIDIKN